MAIENELFKKYTPDIKLIEKYGFIKKDNSYIFEKMFLDSFKAIIKIEDNNITGKVIDLDINEEYNNFRIENNQGSFANTVKEEYEKILLDIRKKCFNRKRFISNQANRIANLISNKYNDEPYFEWEDTPDFGVYKNKDTKKWYALIMNIDKEKLKDGHGRIDVLNVKIDENKIIELLKSNKYYPAYHMNKKYWLTIPLDERIEDNEIMNLIEESYGYAEGISGELLKNEWIIPANPKYYDIEKEYQKSNTIIWKQSSDVKVGDIVYIYVASPVSALKYKTKAIEVNIPYEYKLSNVNMTQVMKLECIEIYDNNLFTLDILKKFGVTTIRGPRYMPKKLKKFIDVNKKKGN